MLMIPARSSAPQTFGLGCWRSFLRFQTQNLTAGLLAAMMLLAGLQQAGALPTITSVVPGNGATGVSPSAPVVFTFSTAMDPVATVATFFDTSAGFQSPSVIPVWSVGNTVLTCSPWPAFANSHTIQWQVIGQDPVGNPLTGTTSGSFTTVAGVGGGSGTNSLTSFLVAEYTYYLQTSPSPPVPDAFAMPAKDTLPVKP